MSLVKVEFDTKQLSALKEGNITPAIRRALRKAGATALRDMRSEATKRVRGRKRIKVGAIRNALVMRRPKGGSIDGSEWVLQVRGGQVGLISYPHRQTKLKVGPKRRQG